MKVDFYISSLSSGGAEHVLRKIMGEEAEKSTERLSREVICKKWRELAYRVSGEVQ